MSNRAVVILTEPEHCELAGADVLTQAMLQLQQLNNAGLTVSQTFCDHPAAAMKFIEAYAKAFPELQRSAASGTTGLEDIFLKLTGENAARELVDVLNA